jgi:hypothetical protein
MLTKRHPSPLTDAQIEHLARGWNRLWVPERPFKTGKQRKAAWVANREDLLGREYSYVPKGEKPAAWWDYEHDVGQLHAYGGRGLEIRTAEEGGV